MVIVISKGIYRMEIRLMNRKKQRKKSLIRKNKRIGNK